MEDPTVPQMIADLRADGQHYAGSGGAAALAKDLGVHPQTLKAWRAGRLPSFKHRRALRALWEKHCRTEEHHA